MKIVMLGVATNAITLDPRINRIQILCRRVNQMTKVELFIDGEKVYEKITHLEIEHVHFRLDNDIMVSYER